IIEDGVDGFLIKPFDVKAARMLINKLKVSPELRERIAVAAQNKARKYESRMYRTAFWTLVEKMVDGSFGRG
ncbi:MAG: hypothetical protein ACK4HQ_06340, partial [Brevinematales bacterium]